MKISRVGLVVSLLSLLLLEPRDARLLENDFFLGAGNPSAFDPELNSVMGQPRPDPARKSGVPCDEGGVQALKGSSSNDSNMLTFKFKESQESRGVVYNVLPKGPASPSGPSPKGNAELNTERLSKSGHSPGVGHMQVFNTAKSRQSDGAHMQDGAQKRILKSTPSPGGGH